MDHDLWVLMFQESCGAVTLAAPFPMPVSNWKRRPQTSLIVPDPMRQRTVVNGNRVGIALWLRMEALQAHTLLNELIEALLGCLWPGTAISAPWSRP
jgi:hypothetical protein